ncbi:MAG: transglutaminase domain-containing protein [Methanobacteriaceae archaeon]|nr:transglutaminase domain-containing protein [Methanobacteriaceae archaeon]MDP3485613.1 transglutaminase domain-containing protein [Methanobacteriaceae archaeon]
MIGGDKISRKMQIAIVIAICIAFSCSSTIYAQDINQPISSDNTSYELVSNNSSIGNSSTEIDQNKTIVDTLKSTKNNSTELEEADVVNNESERPNSTSLNNNSAKEEIKAAGTTNSKYSAKFDLKSIKSAASKVKVYIETNHKLPGYVVISNYNLTMSEFLYLLVKGITQINSGISTSITLKSVSAASNPNGNSKVGVLYKSAYLTLASKVAKYIENYGRAPNYASSSLGNIQYQRLIYTMSKILNFQATKVYLPKYVSLTSISISGSSNTGEVGISNVNDAYNGEILSNYLKSTSNCQVTNSQISALSASITKGLSSKWSKASAIFNWVRNNLNYSFYYNTKYGAVQTLQLKKGNCVDHSHLLISLARAAGIQSRYVHGSAVFNSGTTYGHVWAQLYINGVWYAADAISYSNSLGVIKNWNTSSVTIKNKYAELPF